MLLHCGPERRRHQGRFAVIGWLLPMVMVTSWYPLYAALKGELLPVALSASLFGDTRPHVSLIETLLWQIQARWRRHVQSRQPVLAHDSRRLAGARPDLLVGGAAATALNLLRGIRDRQALAVALLGLFPLYYLARGGLVFNFYILFAIPFFCLNIAAAARATLGRMPGWAGAVVVATIAGALVVTYWQAGIAQPLYATRSSQAGRAAIAWIRQSLPAQSVIVADDSFWPDLREPKPGAPAFPNIHSHWKVGSDPEVGEGIFHNDWHSVDYLIMTPGLAKTFAECQ